MKTRCFYQVYKEGKSTCVYDPENNRKCPGYIMIQILEVKEND